MAEVVDRSELTRVVDAVVDMEPLSELLRDNGGERSVEIEVPQLVEPQDGGSDVEPRDACDEPRVSARMGSPVRSAEPMASTQLQDPFTGVAPTATWWTRRQRTSSAMSARNASMTASRCSAVTGGASLMRPALLRRAWSSHHCAGHRVRRHTWG